MMSWFLKLAFVLGICAVSATAKSVQTEDVSESAMTAEEEAFFMKMATVMLKAQAMEGFTLAAAEDHSLEKRYPTGTGQCTSSGNVAECCGNFGFYLNLGFIKQQVNLDACIRGEFLPDNYGVHLTVTFNNDKIIDTEISGRNPPAVCAGIPGVKIVSVCIKVSDITIADNGDFHACFALSAKALWQTLISFDFGCISSI